MLFKDIGVRDRCDSPEVLRPLACQLLISVVYTQACTTVQTDHIHMSVQAQYGFNVLPIIYTLQRLLPAHDWISHSSSMNHDGTEGEETS